MRCEPFSGKFRPQATCQSTCTTPLFWTRELRTRLKSQTWDRGIRFQNPQTWLETTVSFSSRRGKTVFVQPPPTLRHVRQSDLLPSRRLQPRWNLLVGVETEILGGFRLASEELSQPSRSTKPFTNTRDLKETHCEHNHSIRTARRFTTTSSAGYPQETCKIVQLAI